MRDIQLERINNRIENLLDDLTVLKGLERSGSDVSAFIQNIAMELHQLENRKRYLPPLASLQKDTHGDGAASVNREQPMA